MNEKKPQQVHRNGKSQGVEIVSSFATTGGNLLTRKSMCCECSFVALQHFSSQGKMSAAIKVSWVDNAGNESLSISDMSFGLQEKVSVLKV